MTTSMVPTWKEWLDQHPGWHDVFRDRNPFFEQARQAAYETWQEECKRARRTPPEEDGFPYHYTLPEE